MRIAIFTNNYLPNPYGVSMSIESFRREFEKRGHEVYIFAPAFKGYEDKNPNVHRFPSINVTFRGINYPVAIPFSFSIDKFLENLELDIIHAQHPNLLGWQAKRWAKKKNIPLIYTWHTLYDLYAHFTPLIPDKIAAWWAIRNAVNFADKSNYVITPTPSITKKIKDWGVKNVNIASIASGVNEDEFALSDGKSVRLEMGIADDETLLVFIGRITAEKNVCFLMSSVAQVLKKNKKIKFLVCGGGDQISSMEKIAKDAGIEKQTIFAGLIPNDLRKNYFAAGDIFVHASKSETQGMVLTEAMYMGLPVVSIRATGANDLVGNFVTGILTNESEDEFSAAIEKLVADRGLRQKFSENAKSASRENYTSSVCAQKMLEIYEKVTEKKFL